MEPWLVALYAKIEGIKSEVEGMKATNDYCRITGRPPEYEHEEFQEKADALFTIATIARRE